MKLHDRAARLRASLRDSQLHVEFNIGELTTYRVGGRAALFVEVQSERDLHALAGAVAATDEEVLIVGRGSNMLVADRGFPGLAIQLGSAFDTIAFDATAVTVGGAALLPVVARRCVAEGLTGFEWAVGVPGSIGGAVRMNAGGHGSDMRSSLERATIVDMRSGAASERPVADLNLSYRSSAIAAADVVVSARLRLAYGDRGKGEAQTAEIVRWRREHQPGGQNAGSVFTNPPGTSAGKLIDACGCKGLRVGSAHVSEKHANFFQAGENGSADDVRELMREVQRRVRASTGINLHPETCLVGFEDVDEEYD